MRITVVIALAALLVVALAAEVTAQRMPSGPPSVDMGAPSNRGMAGQSVPWSGPPNANVPGARRQPQEPRGPYFRPSQRPFQGSAARRWQRRMNRFWGGVPADRNVPPPQRRAVPQFAPRSQSFVAPQSFPIIECFGTRCRRVFPPTR